MTASFSFRIGYWQWHGEDRFGQLREFLKRHADIVDQVTLFSASTHSPLPLDEMARRCEVMARRMADLRGDGFATGINVLATIGHNDEWADGSLGDRYQRMVDIDGHAAKACYCPNDPAFGDYVDELYTLTAKAGPDYIWLDDDLRMNMHGHLDGCFCDRCLEKFAKRIGRPLDREEIKQAFNGGKIAERLAIRTAWIAQNRQVMCDGFERMKKAIRAVSPNMIIGCMDIESAYEGMWTPSVAKILSDEGRIETYWRPGSGNYTDTFVDGMISKSQQIARIVAMLPDYVKTIQCEIESFFYQGLAKSARYTALETAGYIAAGARGAAFNILPINNERLEDHDALVGNLVRHRAFFDLLAEQTDNSHLVGVYDGNRPDGFACRNLSEGPWLGREGQPYRADLFEMMRIGLPVTPCADDAAVTALTGDMVWGIDDGSLEKVLAGGVYLDGAAAAILHQRGMGHLVGFRPVVIDADSAFERFSDHALNGPDAGMVRDVRFVPGAVCWALEPLGDGAEVLCDLVGFDDEQKARCCMGVFANERGGRVCVTGYHPWRYMQSGAKSRQIKAVMAHLGGEALTAVVSSFHKAYLWARKRRDGAVVLVVMNAGMDAAEHLTIRVAGGFSAVDCWDMNAQCCEVSGTAGEEGMWDQVDVGTVEPFDMRLLVL